MTFVLFILFWQLPHGIILLGLKVFVKIIHVHVAKQEDGTSKEWSLNLQVWVYALKINFLLTWTFLITCCQIYLLFRGIHSSKFSSYQAIQVLSISETSSLTLTFDLNISRGDILTRNSSTLILTDRPTGANYMPLFFKGWHKFKYIEKFSELLGKLQPKLVQSFAVNPGQEDVCHFNKRTVYLVLCMGR